MLVLFGRKDGSFYIAASSDEASEQLPHGENLSNLEVRRNSLFLSSSGGNDCETQLNTEQYKFRDGSFVQIGRTRWITSVEGMCDIPYKDITEDTNLLTGDKIITDKSGKEPKISKTKVPKERLLKLEEWPG